MALVTVETEYYACPHCNGEIKIRMQYYFEGGESHTVYHVDENGKEEEMVVQLRD